MANTFTDSDFFNVCKRMSSRPYKREFDDPKVKRAIVIALDIDRTLLETHKFLDRYGEYDHKAAAIAQNQNNDLLQESYDNDKTVTKENYRKSLDNFGMFTENGPQIIVAYLRPNAFALLQTLVELRRDLSSDNCVVKIVAATHGTNGYARILIKKLNERLANYCGVESLPEPIFDCVLAREIWKKRMRDQMAIKAYYGKSLKFVVSQCLSTEEKQDLSVENIRMMAVDDNPWVWCREDNNAGNILFVEPWRVRSCARQDFLEAAGNDSSLYSLQKLIETLFLNPSQLIKNMVKDIANTGMIAWLTWMCQDEKVAETLYRIADNDRRQCLLGTLLMLTVFRKTNPKVFTQLVEEQTDELREVILALLDWQCYLRSETGHTKNFRFCDWLNACRPLDVIQFSVENKPTKLSRKNHRRAARICKIISKFVINSNDNSFKFRMVLYRHFTTMAPLNGVFKCKKVSALMEYANQQCDDICENLLLDSDTNQDCVLKQLFPQLME